MLYAWIVICLASAPSCDVDHLDAAVHAEQSPPLFDTEEECHTRALRHLHESPIPELRENTEYQIDVECERAKTIVDDGA